MREGSEWPEGAWEHIYEMWGACGIEPWPHSWAEYRRLFLGWRRYRWEFAGEILAGIANGPLVKKGRGLWGAWEWTRLIPAPAKVGLWDGFKEMARQGRKRL